MTEEQEEGPRTTRIDEAKRLIEDAKVADERKDSKRVLELCDDLLANYSDLVNGPALREKRAIALCAIGRFSEAEPVFRQFLEEHRQLGLPIANSTWMYHLLVCYNKGDSQKALDQFAHLRDEAKAVALLNKGAEPEPTRVTEPERSAANALGPTDLARHIEELGKASDTCWDSYEAIEASGAAAIPYLLPLISRDNYLLRGRSIDLLGKIGDARVLEPLRRAAAISEKEFRAMISAPSGSPTVETDGQDIPVRDMLTEYRRMAKDAYEAVNARIGTAVQKDGTDETGVAARQPKTVRRWWQFWK